MTRHAFRRAAAAALVVLVGACGGGPGGGSGSASDYNVPTSPTGPGSGVQSGATITIGANGAIAPAQVTINVGQGVTFVNNHNRAHNISSDPHNLHTDCPALNSIALITAGQTKTSAAFTTARNCGYHDHDDPDNAAMKATVVVR